MRNYSQKTIVSQKDIRKLSVNLYIKKPPVREAFCYPRRALNSFVNAGTTSSTSPTIPKVAILNMGASGFLLIAMMVSEEDIPARCWTAPEIPQAKYTFGPT